MSNIAHRQRSTYSRPQCVIVCLSAGLLGTAIGLVYPLITVGDAVQSGNAAFEEPIPLGELQPVIFPDADGTYQGYENPCLPVEPGSPICQRSLTDTEVNTRGQ